MDEFRRSLYEKLMGTLRMTEEMPDEALYRKIDEVLSEAGRERHMTLALRKHYRDLLYAALRRLDILSLLLDDEGVSEVMINGPERIFVEKEGRILPWDETFTTPEKLEDVIQIMASSINRRVNEASPMADARLPDGSRVNIVLPPVALDGPAVTVRRFPKERIGMKELIRRGSITEEAAEFLGTLVRCGYNIFISGGTGSGKTTFLGALSEYIPPEERVITIEDSAELSLCHTDNLVRLESRPPNLEGEYEITIRQLIRNALRMRPDRILLGEVRGGEALDLLQAFNTGHDGSLSTGHANSAEDMLSRLETLCLMGNVDLPLPAIRSQIASGVDILVHLCRLRDRTRRVRGIYEVTGMKEDKIETVPLFLFREEGTKEGKILGHLRRTDRELRNTGKLRDRGGRLRPVPDESRGGPPDGASCDGAPGGHRLCLL